MGRRFHYYPLSTLPRLHSIVWCRLPQADNSPGHEVRPVLVRGSKHDPNSSRAVVLVSYGTQNLNLNERGAVDLVIQNNARMSELDLPTAVRFDLDLENWLPWASEFFDAPEHSPYMVAGILTDQEKAVLRARLSKRRPLAM